MFLEDKIIVFYCIVDDVFVNMWYYEDFKVQVSDSEVIIMVFVLVLYFGGYLDNVWYFMKMKGYIFKMLGKLWFCRWFYCFVDFLIEMFFKFGKDFKDMVGVVIYRLDFFFVVVCDNICISWLKILCGEVFWGKYVVMCRYFYGVWVQVMIWEGIFVEFCLVLGSEYDSQVLGKLFFDVVLESCIYMDVGYIDYQSEEDFFDVEFINVKVQCRKNSKRKDEFYVDFIKEQMCKQIEIEFSQIKVKMLRCIYVVI